jgi:hypothetical protein
MHYYSIDLQSDGFEVLQGAPCLQWCNRSSAAFEQCSICSNVYCSNARLTHWRTCVRGRVPKVSRGIVINKFLRYSSELHCSLLHGLSTYFSLVSGIPSKQCSTDSAFAAQAPDAHVGSSCCGFLVVDVFRVSCAHIWSHQLAGISQ